MTRVRYKWTGPINRIVNNAVKLVIIRLTLDGSKCQMNHEFKCQRKYVPDSILNASSQRNQRTYIPTIKVV